MNELSGKVAIVTGSSRGFGEAIARSLAAKGADVAITYFTEQEGEEHRARKIAEEIGSNMVFPLNIRIRESVTKLMKCVFDDRGRIDILINNAGVNVVGDFDQITDDQWNIVLDTNLRGSFVCCQEVLPYISDGGRIIMVGSVAAKNGGPRTPSYAASKAGLLAVMLCLARFIGPRGITVNTISPGIIESEMLEQTMSQSLKDTLLPNILLKRMGSSNDVANAVLFLCSSEADYITAQNIHVDGGLCPHI